MKSKFLLAVVIMLLSNCNNNPLVDVVNKCKVIELQQYQTMETVEGKLQSKMNYIVITDKERFNFTPALDGSHDFFLLKKDSIYNFEVAGFKMFGRNILRILK